jgi:SAM-dependent methyltransferase
MLGVLRALVRLPADLVGDRRRADDLAAARRALLESGELEEDEGALLRNVSLETHRRDTMYEPGRGRHYLGVGLSGLRCVDRAFGAGREPSTVLDFACGYGRVLRFLRVRYPRAELWASEVDPVALDFCTRTFGASGLLSSVRLDRLTRPERFELIWCGSLLTHLDEERAGDLLAFFATHLASGGVCVASAHGTLTIDGLRTGRDRYGLPDQAVERTLSHFDATGYGYADYAGMSGYGISIASREKLRTMAGRAGLVETSFQPRGWDDHHDVYGFSLGE